MRVDVSFRHVLMLVLHIRCHIGRVYVQNRSNKYMYIHYVITPPTMKLTSHKMRAASVYILHGNVTAIAHATKDAVLVLV